MTYKQRVALAAQSLFEKYEIGMIDKIRIDDSNNSIFVSCNNQNYEFIDDFENMQPTNNSAVYLFHWRKDRKYIEMKNLIENKLVINPVGMRIKNITNKSYKVQNTLMKEIDFIQWILNDRIAAVFADTYNNEYFNIIFFTEKNIKISAEIGTAVTCEDIELHEIITQKGIVTDMPADTQIKHYPIYLFNSDSKEVFNNIDFELYEIEHGDIMKIRFIADVFNNSTDRNLICNESKRNQKIIHAIYESSSESKKIFV